MNRWILAGTLAVSVVAFATADEDAAQAGNKPRANMGPTSWGDPMKIADTSVTHQTTDVQVQTSMGPFQVNRSFFSNKFTWSKGQSLQWLNPPFGPHPARVESAEWMHNLFSFVVQFTTQGPPDDPGDPEFAVRDLNGTYIKFGYNVPGAIPLAPDSADTSGARLHLTTRTGYPSQYVLVRPGQGRYIYGHHFSQGGRFFWFLSAIEGEQYDNSVTGYSVTDGGSLGPTQATISYVPSTTKIDVVKLVDGQSLKFYYNTNGTLDRIDLRDRQQATVSVAAQYSYTAGRLTGVTDASGRSETYSYGSGTPEFKVVANSLLVSKKTLATTPYSEADFDETPDRVVQVQRRTPSITPATEPDCDVNAFGNCTNNWRTWLQQTTVYEGDGNSTPVTVSVQHFYRPSSDQTTRQREVCTKTSGICTAFTQQTATWAYNFVTTDVTNYTDRTGNGTAYAWSPPSTSATPYSGTELTQIAAGSGGGSPALHTQSMTYEYAGASRSTLRFYEQELLDSSEASVVPGCALTATTTFKRDPNTNFLKAVIKQGCTRLVTGSEQQAPVVRYLATFYFKRYACEGSSTNDPLGRTLEVHGPCFVVGNNSTDCNANPAGIIPITQYEYWPATEPSDRANRLKRVSTFTNNTGTGCNSGQRRLDTTFNTYDAWGHVLSSTDANGVVTTRGYTGQRIDWETTAGATKTYSYDATTNQLTAVQLPAGNFEVYCYRTGVAANAACTGGAPTEKLMWKAIAATATGANPVERVDYTYVNGKVATESYYEGGATTPARVKKYEADPLGRPTFEQWGQGSGSYFAAKRFDGEGRPTLQGLPYNHPDGLCQNQVAGNERCSATVYDRLDRIERDVSYPTYGSAAQETFFAYDYQSNLTAVTPNGQPPLVGYEYDDFGRTISILGNWTGQEGGAIAPKALQEFDAAGNIVKRWMPGTSGTQLESWVYDSMSRVKESRAGTTLLWSNVYDGDAAPHPFCPAVSSSKLLGRLQVKADSFGNSWYEYDSLGNILKIRRERLAGSNCSYPGDSSADATPDSEFTYSADGRLLTEKYPHGRLLEYVYGTAGKQHRVVTIKAAIGSPTPANLVQNIDYFSFGGVKTYQFATTGGATTVNNLRGDNGTGELPTTCGVFWPPTTVGDSTGRIRMLQVIRSATNIFRRGYRWDADQLVEEKTCLLDDSTPTTLSFSLGSAKGYDQKLQLKNVSRPSGEFAARGGPFQQRTFTYDSIGARTSISDVGYTFNETIGTRGRLTASVLATGGATHLQSSLTYDAQGRMNGKLQYLGVASWGRTVYPVPDDGVNGAVGAVYKQMLVNGGTYQYFYDSAGRRRYKIYPTGVHDEFFHHGVNMVEDRGSKSAIEVTDAPLDDYIWLDGKPVALIKSQLDIDWLHKADRTGVCQRVGYEDANCGVYFIVPDHLGKPVLMLNEAGQVTGTGEYDSFGLVNTVTHPAETNYYGVRYANNQSLNLGTFNQPTTPYQSVRMRVRFGQVSARNYTSRGVVYNDYVDVVDSWGNLLTPRYAGYNLGSFKTPWFSPPSGSAIVRFTSDVYSDTGYDGVVLDGYEYQRYQTGAQPVWTALRFPGQYFDLETEFAENWNRFYDARDGRYIAADPARAVVSRGSAITAYAYADNNPVMQSDATGNCPMCLGLLIAMALTWEADEVVRGSDGKEHGGVNYVAPLPAFGSAGIAIAATAYNIGGAAELAAGTASGDANSPHFDAAVGNFASALMSGAEGRMSTGTREPPRGQSAGSSGGERAGMPFTRKGQREIKEANKAANNGQMRCVNPECGIDLVDGKQSVKGGGRPSNEAQADHADPMSKGGDGSPSNGQLLCPTCNGVKLDKPIKYPTQ